MITLTKKHSPPWLYSIIHSRSISLRVFLLGPPLMFFLVEMLNRHAFWRYLSVLQICLNLAFFYIFFFCTYLILGRFKLAAGVSSIFFYLLGTVNHYLLQFRGRVLFPDDFGSITTAINVVQNYNFTPDILQIFSTAALLSYLALLVILPRSHGRDKFNFRVILPLVGVSASFLILFFGTEFLRWADIKPTLWNTLGNGYLLNFSISLKYRSINAPDGYGDEEAAAIAENIQLPAPSEGIVPENIIVVMNESFSDLSVLGDFAASSDWMPFYRSLEDNCIKGWAYASVFGGNTANSEYEFLTGNTMVNLPDGAVPYQLYINENSSALSRQLRGLGYNTVAMHPYLPSGWNRIPVYSHFEFDTVMFQDDFINQKFMRNYVTDKSNYENLIRVYEEKSTQSPLFIFNVTMQNHSPYDAAYRGLTKTVWLTGEHQNKFPDVDQYLSLIKESDKALEYLLEYFEGVQEPTMILFFGDHQPKLSDEFYELVFGKSLDELDVSEQQSRHMVPFFIWANYELDEESDLELSINYLSSLLMSNANLPLTGYQQFLLELSESVPVINSIGLRENGVDLSSSDELSPKAAELVGEYEILQYCNMFEPEDWPENFFELDIDYKYP